MRRLESGVVVLGDGVVDRGNLGLDVGLELGGQLVPGVLEGLLGLVREVLRPVLDLDRLGLLAVLLGVGLGLLDHPLHLVLLERGRAGDGHLVLLAGAAVMRGDVEDAVGVDVEGDLDLRHSARRRRDPIQGECPQDAVVPGQRPLALQDHDLHARLRVRRGGEDLRLGGRDGGVALDELGVDLSLGHDPERERGDVEEQDVLDLALEHAGLDGGSDRHHLVGVDSAVGVLSGQLLDQGLDHRHPGRAADQDHVLQVLDAHVRVGQRVLEGLAAARGQVLGELLKLGP